MEGGGTPENARQKGYLATGVQPGRETRKGVSHVADLPLKLTLS